MKSSLTKSKPDHDQETDHSEDSKHVVFRLADELYATPLLTIREIIKMQPIKPVPYMLDYFRGIIDLRGLVLSIIDLRLKFHIPCPDPNQGLLIVIATAIGPIGAIVDDIVSVSDFTRDKVETKLALKTKISSEFLLGVGHLNDRLVNIIDIEATLTSDDIAVMQKARGSSGQAMPP